jgi:hypothetical protein
MINFEPRRIKENYDAPLTPFARKMARSPLFIVYIERIGML